MAPGDDSGGVPVEDARLGPSWRFRRGLLEFDRLSSAYGRVVVGVAIHQNHGLKTFGEVSNTGLLVTEGYRQLLSDDLSRVADSTAATIAEFTRGVDGLWGMREVIRGFDSDPVVFMAEMGTVGQP